MRGYEALWVLSVVLGSAAVAGGQVLNESAKLLASDGSVGDTFGNAVSVSGNVAFIGTPYDDDNGSDSGAVYVFRWDGSSWVLEQKLLASDGAANDRFGNSVSVCGEVGIVGATLDDDNGADSGSAYVFRYDASQTVCGQWWCEEQKLLASDGAVNHRLAADRAVSISGNVVLLGAGSFIGINPGAAYVFRYDASQTVCGQWWCEEQKLLASDGVVADQFGASASNFGDVAIVGATWDDDNGTNSGSAYVFRYDASRTVCGQWWCEEQKLLPSDPGASELLFGNSVSVSGEVAVVGSVFHDHHSGPNSGSAYVFRWNGSLWVPEQELVAADEAADDNFGVSVSVSGDLIVAAAYKHDDNGSESGSAYVFRWNGTSWIQKETLLPSDGAPGDRFGHGVSVSGQTILVGANFDDDSGIDSGTAYVFTASCPSSSAPRIEQVVNALGVEVDSTKNRYLSFTAGNPGQQQAIRIKTISVPAGFEGWIGSTFWVGVPTQLSELSGKDDNTPPTFPRSLVECALTDTLFLTDWASRGTIHVTGPQIVPGATYEIAVVNKACNTTTEDSFPPESTVVLDTSRWGDVAGPFSAVDQTWTAPDATVSVAFDVVAILDKFKNAPTAPRKSRADIQPHPVDAKITIVDVTRALDAFSGAPFPFAPADPTTPCP